MVEELAGLVETFLAELADLARHDHYALDGKTVRGTIPKGQTQGLHLVAVYVPGTGVTLKQLAVSADTNEVPVAQQALNSLDLQGKVVTADALHTQRDTSAVVLARGGAYVWLAKDNQPRLKQDIAQLFAPEVHTRAFSPGPTDFQTQSEVVKGRGRIEKRTSTTSSLLSESSDWPGLAQVFQLRRRVASRTGELLRDQVVYSLTSLPPEQADPRRLLQLQRRHWAIESQLHYRRDVTLGEDAGRCLHTLTAHAHAILNNLVLALLLHKTAPNAAAMRRFYNAHPDRAFNLLLRPPARL